ncbi:LysR family transcriptional regulator [Sphingobacterium spiritivorum]|uniref:LysR family transcriptional regulator n=1 Tax=Sphingobacterium spiritivorum TaxID=258 RepID=UPI00191B6BFE|nr:LysR family transcriptional regulator [Sphingobacterium spiritivorum]QQT25895.1 LysR family transcriptional regulator [Sphingobacterium spiritivorum]
MELRHLHYFAILAEELHFGRAAERLCISQPPLSRQIKDLEEELAVTLFERNNKRVNLTAAGTYFLKETHDILRLLEKAKLKARQIQDSVSGTFRLGYISSTPKALLARVLNIVKEHYPHLHICLYETSTQKQVAALENGKLDLGIVRTPILSDQLSTYTLLKESFCLATNEDFNTDAGKLSDLAYVSYSKEYAPEYYQQFITYCHYLGFDPHVLHECNTMQSILELVASGLGAAIVPQSVQHHTQHLQIRFSPLPIAPIYTETVLAFDRESRHPALSVFTDIITAEYKMFYKGEIKSNI